MKALRRGISYNHACMILEANNYKITDTMTIKNQTVFYHGNKKVARYNETTGTLSVIKKENKNGNQSNSERNWFTH